MIALDPRAAALWHEAMRAGAVVIGPDCDGCGPAPATAPFRVHYSGERARLCLSCLSPFVVRVRGELADWLAASLAPAEPSFFARVPHA